MILGLFDPYGLRTLQLLYKIEELPFMTSKYFLQGSGILTMNSS